MLWNGQKDYIAVLTYAGKVGEPAEGVGGEGDGPVEGYGQGYQEYCTTPGFFC